MRVLEKQKVIAIEWKNEKYTSRIVERKRRFKKQTQPKLKC